MTTKVARVGFDWPDADGGAAKVDEELERAEDGGRRRSSAEEEVGDLLFAVVNLARHLGVDPESALKAANRKFRRRFAHVEARLRESGREPADSTSTRWTRSGRKRRRASDERFRTPWVRTRDDARAHGGRAGPGSRALALDTESDSLHHHREKVCLVQLAAEGGRAWLVDPLALRDLAPLGALIADPAVTKVLPRRRLRRDHPEARLRVHVRGPLRHHDRRALPGPARGRPAGGRGAASWASPSPRTARRTTGRAGRSRRPRSATRRDDVRHLLLLQERLAGQAGRAGPPRLGARRSATAVAALEPARRRSEPDAWQKIKGIRAAPAARAQVVKHVHAWREALAEATDVPAFRSLNTEALFALAKNPPRTEAELRGVRASGRACARTRRRCWRRSRRPWPCPDAQLSVIPSSPRAPQVAPETKKRASTRCAPGAPRRARGSRSTSRSCCPSDCWSAWRRPHPRSVEALARIEGLRRWRVEALGDSMLAALRTTPA